VDVAAALASIVGVAAVAALLLYGLGRRFLGGRVALVFLGGLLVAGGVESVRAIRHALLTHRTGARETAAQIAPHLAGSPPSGISFRAAGPRRSVPPLRTSASYPLTTPRPWTEVRAEKVRADLPEGARRPARTVQASARRSYQAQIRPVDAQAAAPDSGVCSSLIIAIPCLVVFADRDGSALGPSADQIVPASSRSGHPGRADAHRLVASGIATLLVGRVPMIERVRQGIRWGSPEIVRRDGVATSPQARTQADEETLSSAATSATRPRFLREVEDRRPDRGEPRGAGPPLLAAAGGDRRRNCG
jgi:hypothetical protein